MECSVLRKICSYTLSIKNNVFSIYYNFYLGNNHITPLFFNYMYKKTLLIPCLQNVFYVWNDLSCFVLLDLSLLFLVFQKAMTHINIFISTDRPLSQSEAFAKFLSTKYLNAGAEVQLLSVADFPIDEVIGGKYGQLLPKVEAFNDRFLDCDGIVFVVPEYNGSFPGILKLFMDYLPFPQALINTPLCFNGLASGAFGALRAVEQLQMICNYRNAPMFPERVFIQRLSQNFVNGEIKDELTRTLLDQQVVGFVKFIQKFNQS